MALVLRGSGSVIWSQHQDAFPYIKGMLVIFLSWVCSPISAGVRRVVDTDMTSLHSPPLHCFHITPMLL
jgi:hypothetical protein